jgi:hypothetical protein
MVRTTAPPAPRDPHLPALDLLDGGRLAESLFGAGVVTGNVTDPKVTYVEYTPGRSLVLQADLVVDGHPRAAVLRAGTAVDRVARATGAPVPSVGAVLHWLPADPHVRMPAAASDLAHSPWFAVTRARTGPDLPDAALEMLSYVPGRRATFGVGPYVVKTYGSDARFALARDAQRLLSKSVELPTPRAVGALPEHRMTIQRRVAGQVAGRDRATHLAGAAGDLIDKLHSSARSARVRRGPWAQLRAAHCAVTTLTAVAPGEAARSRRLLRRLTDTAPVGLPMVLSHGDFSIDQLLVDPRGTLTVTDVDNACQAPAALDLASFAANVMSGRVGDAEHSDAVLGELLARRAAPPALEWFYAAAVLRRCDRPFRRQKKHWPEKSSAILDHVERVTVAV